MGVPEWECLIGSDSAQHASYHHTAIATIATIAAIAAIATIATSQPSQPSLPSLPSHCKPSHGISQRKSSIRPTCHQPSKRHDKLLQTPASSSQLTTILTLKGACTQTLQVHNNTSTHYRLTHCILSMPWLGTRARRTAMTARDTTRRRERRHTDTQTHRHTDT